MGGIQTGTVTSADGTVIIFDQSGEGPAVVLVQGALMGRADPVMSGIAAGLSRWFTVFSYDRRGRGDSPAWMGRAGEAVAGAIPGAVHRVLEGQVHYVAPEAIVPELLEFLVAA